MKAAWWLIRAYQSTKGVSLLDNASAVDPQDLTGTTIDHVEFAAFLWRKWGKELPPAPTAANSGGLYG